jgi:uncharacterized membrane protein YczE
MGAVADGGTWVDGVGALARVRRLDGYQVRAAGLTGARVAAGRATGAVASAITMRSGLGTGPWDTLFTALHAATGAGYGTLAALAALGFAALATAHGARPRLVMVANALAGGLLVGVVLPRVPAPATPVAAWAYAVLALTLGVLSGVLVLGAPLARTAYDGALVAVCARRGWGVGRTRLTLDLPALAAGWALGGRVGAGTVLGAALTGPLVQLALRAHGERRAPGRPAARVGPAAVSAAAVAARLTPFEPARAVA